jgi:hypothetical protein
MPASVLKNSSGEGSGNWMNLTWYLQENKVHFPADVKTPDFKDGLLLSKDSVSSRC